MKRNQHSWMKAAFTLTELLIVLGILVVIWIIAFLLVTKWLTKSKDAARSSDIHTIQKALDVGMVDIGYYPKPENSTAITFSDDDFDENGESTEIWDQGIFGSSTLRKLGNIDKVPLDPLSRAEYTYSVTKDGRLYQVWAIYEDDVVFNDLASSVYASNNNIQAFVRWNYNNLVMQVTVGEWRKKVNCLVTIPSIMLAHISGTGLNLNNDEDAYFVFDREFNLPSSYEWAFESTRNWAFFKPGSAYCEKDLSILADTNSPAYREFMEEFINIYSKLEENWNWIRGSWPVSSTIRDIAWIPLTGENWIFNGTTGVNITPGIAGIIAGINNGLWNAWVDANAEGLPDYSPPIITRLLPNGVVNTEDITLYAKTDELATCAYSTEDKEYDDMENIFENTRDFEHTTPITLVAGVDTTIYVRCRDGRANKNDESSIITVKYANNNDFAEINFSDDDGVSFECPTCENP